MENSIYLGLSRQMVLKNNMDIIANNVANMNTSGFRGQNLLFSEYVSDPKGPDTIDKENDALSFVMDRGQYEVTEAGPVSFTGNQLDVALNGPGFMGIQSPGGEIAYTRAGNFQLDANGTLVTAAGYPVADTGGGAITIPQGSSEIKIDDRGFVSNQDGQIGQIMIAEFQNPQTLKPSGNGLYTTQDAALPPTNTVMKQGSLEGSNVKPVVEMTRMIETLRSFQTTQKILETENERLLGAIDKLSKM